MLNLKNIILFLTWHHMIWKGETLLLTWTITPHSELGITGYASASLDPKIRLQQYLKAFVYYISESDFHFFVFCENSSYPIEKEKKLLQELADLYGKEIEFLQFKGDHQMTLSKGYGYGEGECLDYAFKHSKLLKKSASWYKITWRYIYSNINQIIASSEKNKNLFFRRMRPLAYFCLCTAFFKVENKVYEKYLYNCKTQLHSGQTIEAQFYHQLRNTEISCWNLKYIPQRIRDPKVLKTYRYHKLLLWLGIRNVNTKFGKLLDFFLYKK